MKIIAFGDIHMSLGAARAIPGIAEADLLLLTGDLTNFGGRSEAKEILNQVMTINPRILAVPGNLDQGEINGYLDELDLNLHGQARLVDHRLCLMGLGGSNPTPFNTPTEYTEEELAGLLRQGREQAEAYCRLSSPGAPRLPSILVSHTPPLNTRMDRLGSGAHVGSAAVRRFIEEEQPDLCLCGHIHEAKGEDWINTTHVLNPGMIHEQGWIEITLDNHQQLSATLR